MREPTLTLAALVFHILMSAIASFALAQVVEITRAKAIFTAWLDHSMPNKQAVLYGKVLQVKAVWEAVRKALHDFDGECAVVWQRGIAGLRSPRYARLRVRCVVKDHGLHSM